MLKMVEHQERKLGCDDHKTAIHLLTLYLQVLLCEIEIIHYLVQAIMILCFIVTVISL